MSPTTAAIRRSCLLQATVRSGLSARHEAATWLLTSPVLSAPGRLGAGHLACVKLLLEEGADIQQAGAVRLCALLACVEGGGRRPRQVASTVALLSALRPPAPR